MKKYIERYIGAVIKRLPEDQREEVRTELESNIYDMLDDDLSDEHIDEVLHELGNPRLIAKNYMDEKKVIIDPLFYNDYITTLKIVLVIFGSLSVLIATCEAVFNTNDMMFWQALGQGVGNVISSLISALLAWFAIITLIFWGMSQPKAKDKILNSWKLKELPDIVKEEKMIIGRISTMIEFIIVTILSLFFVIILIYFIDMFGWYKNGVLVVQLFDTSMIKLLIPTFIFTIIINTVVYLMKIKDQKYTFRIVLLNTIGQTVSMIAVLIIINYPGFITQDFINYAASQGNTIDSIELAEGLKLGIRVLSIIVVLTNAIDQIKHWVKLNKTSKLNLAKEINMK